MLLVVNPNDPASLQIANAYAALRDIPSNNILFLAPPSDYHNDGLPITQAEVTSGYLTPIASAMSARGLSKQIDYIGTIGQAVSYWITPDSGLPDTTANSLNYALSLLTPLTNGSGLTLQNATSHYDDTNKLLYMPTSGLYQDPTNIPVGSNTAIQHSSTFSVNYPVANQTITTQYYMSGAIGYTGNNGNTVAQVVASLQSAVASDGARPVGTIYFENSGDIYRSGPRMPQWTYTQSQLTARGIPFVQESSTTPESQVAVRGAACGASNLVLPNGSTYVPGSWADNLTSYGCFFPDFGQTKATEFITAGAAGTTGAVIEPYNITERFTNSSIYTFIADGSTLGEAFAKSVSNPDIQMPLGDMLAQPYADVPQVGITSGPGNYGAAAGTVSLSATAGLTGPQIATGIRTLEVLVDGLVSAAGTPIGGSRTFHLSTTTLSDGVHEVRVVATNDAQAASEGYVVEPIVVNNHSRSISFAGGDVTLSSSAATISLGATPGDGTIMQTELTCLGRVVTTAVGSPGSLSISPSTLAPGDNVIVPVAVFTDGSHVAGGAFVVHVEAGPANGWTNTVGTGLWSNPANWSGGVLPQNNDGVARLRGATSGGTVTLDTLVTVAEIDFDNSGGGNYTLAASTGQTLTLSSTNGPMSQCLINVLSGNHTISAPLSLGALGNLVTVTNSADSLTVSGNVSGIGGLSKTGNGLLSLTANDTYSGGTTISSGTLQLGDGVSGHDAALATSGITNYSSLVYNTFASQTVSYSISGPGSLTKLGAGLLTLAASNSYTGTTTIGSGTLQTTAAGAIPSASTLIVASSAVLNLAGKAQTVAGITLDDGAVLNSGALTTLTLNGLGAGVTYSGAGAGSSISGGTLNLASAGSVSAAHLFSIARGLGSVDLAIVASIADGAATSQSLIKTGNGVLQLSGTNSYSGGTMVSGGTLQVGAGGDSGTLGTGPVVDNAALVFCRSGTLSIANSISGNGSLTQTGPGRLILSGPDTYTGGTLVQGGTLVLAASDSISDGSSLTVGANAAAIFATSAAGTQAATLAVAGLPTVPEPSTLSLTVAGILVAFAFWRRAKGYSCGRYHFISRIV